MSQVREIVEEYNLQRVLNTAGHSTVFQASDPDSGRMVVLKLISPASVGAERGRRKRFLQHMEGLRTAGGPGLPEIVDFGFTPDESAFVVTGYREGLALSSLAGSPPPRTLPLLVQLAAVLERLATAGVGHGNIAPDNVLVSRGEGGEEIVLTGLGSTAYLTSDGASALPGQDADSCPWVAPERFEDGGVDLLRADLWAVAAVVVEVLGGSVEGRGGESPKVHLPSSVAGGDALASQLAGALRGDPGRRDTTPADLLASLEAIPGSVAEKAGPVDRTMAMDRTISATKVSRGTPPSPAGPPPAPADATVVVPAAPSPPSPPATPPAPPVPPPEPDVTTPPVPVPPVRDDEPTMTSKPAPTAKPAPPPRKVPGEPGGRVPLLIGLAVGSVIVLALVMMLVPRPPLRPRPAPEPTAVPVAVLLPTPAPEAPPTPVPLHPDLVLADSLLADEDVDGARKAFERISDEDVAAFTDRERALYDELKEVLRASTLDEAVADLRGGLQHGSIKMLKRAMATLSGVDDATLAADPGLARDVEQAREALRLHRLLWRAHDEGDHLQVLERGAELARVLPGYSGSRTLREQSVAVLEREAEAAVEKRQLDRAIEVLAQIEERWPDRTGISEQLESLRRQRAGVQELRRAIAAARAKGAAGDPEAGLEMLRQLSAPAAMKVEVEELRAALQAQLDEMDARPPTVAMPADVDLDFRKNKTLTVPFEVTDDYQVRQVRVGFRRDSEATFHEVVVHPDADGVYRWQVTPEVHANEDLFFFIEATDRSGHVGRLGSEQQPIKIDRKKWFQP